MNLVFFFIMIMPLSFALNHKKPRLGEKASPSQVTLEQRDLLMTICSKSGIGPGHASEQEIDDATNSYIKKFGPLPSDACFMVYNEEDPTDINQSDNTFFKDSPTELRPRTYKTRTQKQ
jgi:hypothetical protein